MESHAHNVLDKAWEAGIRYFDAARSYGKAEEFLRSWLAKCGISHEECTIGSKWGYTYTADWKVMLAEGQQHEIKDHSLPVLQRQYKESRDLLGNALDLYQIHSASLDSGVFTNQKVLRELADMRETGLHIGLSVSGTQQAETIRKAMEVVFDGAPLFSAVQATWNVLEQSAAPALQEAHDEGVGVIVKEGLANGRLTSRNTSPDVQPKLAELQQQADALHCTVDSLALAAVINQPFVDIALCGAVRIDHLTSNLQALSIIWSDSLGEIMSQLAEPPECYWQARSLAKWN